MVGSSKTLSIMLSQWSIKMIHAHLEMVVSTVMNTITKTVFLGNKIAKIIAFENLVKIFV